MREIVVQRFVQDTALGCVEIARRSRYGVKIAGRQAVLVIQSRNCGYRNVDARL
jgi:hypothetical protein